MNRKRLVWVALPVCFVLFSPSLWAHHGNAAFETSKRVTVKGTVVGWLWANPHCVLTFDAKDDKGNVIHWAAEGTVPSEMAKHGWSRQSFSTGDEITVIVTPAKNGRPVGRIQQVQLPNGQVLTSDVPPDSPTEGKP